MKERKLWESFNYAIGGILYVVRTQRSMRIHLIVAVTVFVLSLFLQLEKIEVIILVFAIALVLITEMFNTALELVVNLITDTYHPLARISKDIAAGAVFFASVNAVVVGYLILFKKYLRPDMAPVLSRVKQSSEYMTFACLMIVLIFVVILKAYSGRGTPMKGGLPSGHSAVAFSVFTATVFISQNILLSLLVIILALLLGHSRVTSGVHSWWEVMAGALLGIGVTTLLFQFFN
ncbi:MAG: diacylglycerol kinase [bacterium]